MNSLVELISKIGIFMIAGQAVIHFAPEQKYAKYIKLIVALMILLQFLTPIYKLLGGNENELFEQLSKMEEDLNGGLYIQTMEDDWNENLINGQIADSGTLNESIIKNMEKEIKSKLNNEISGEGCSVIKVSVDINASNELNNSSYKSYELNKIHAVVRIHDRFENVYDNNSIKVEKITVQKVTSDEDDMQEDELDGRPDKITSTDEQEIKGQLRERFCNVLGIEEECMEVSIYGTVE